MPHLRAAPLGRPYAALISSAVRMPGGGPPPSAGGPPLPRTRGPPAAALTGRHRPLLPAARCRLCIPHCIFSGLQACFADKGVIPSLHGMQMSAKALT